MRSRTAPRGGTALGIVYAHVTSYAVYYATVIMRCEVP